MIGTKINKKSVSKGNTSESKTGSENNKTYSRQKVLLPTLKEQQRYVVYKIIIASSDNKNNTSNNNNTFKDFGAVHNNIISQCNSFLGIFDGSKAGLQSAKYDAQKMCGIIRVDSKYVDKLKVCLGMIKEINETEVIVDCTYVSGMLNKAVEKIQDKIPKNNN